ncbi:cell wall-associated NlpC family hydrolase [Novosphingobium chloroacetimidivorans]|uniref:Cell wall-associated NlpC family hydrolase n=1 Tax=Novosphingobium chloroacetimidivorans TaxID=1428314 RepID=A0A7W7KDE3_9SPHN|nr:hypothetical protein [Novosphingobium chloroacetimidivorans]MBB4860043.1 cell wall-associated NlpC family hydrolase [Novosphingobium chloroacetimidivorans]
MIGTEFAKAAEALAGTRFRLHGRDPATGLDCLGLVVAALAATGRSVALPRPFGLRRLGLAAADEVAASLGLAVVTGETIAGDVLLAQCSPIQPHLAVALASGRIVHAHAGLGRVVVGSGDPTWTIARHWRFPPAF